MNTALPQAENQTLNEVVLRISGLAVGDLLNMGLTYPLTDCSVGDLLNVALTYPLTDCSVGDFPQHRPH